MPENNDKKLVKVNGLGTVAFPKGMEDHKIAEAIKNHIGSRNPAQDTAVKTKPIPNALPHEDPQAKIPPQVERIMNAIGVEFNSGKRFNGYQGKDVVASVDEHEPHKIEVNNKDRFLQGPNQVAVHEVIHLWHNNLPPALQKLAPPDDPKNPYDISDVDQLREKGVTLEKLPQEKAATVIQMWVAYPQLRKRLQPWMDDLTKIPLSTVIPTSPDQKGINTTLRAPMVPIEGYTRPTSLLNEARKRKP